MRILLKFPQEALQITGLTIPTILQLGLKPSTVSTSNVHKPFKPRAMIRIKILMISTISKYKTSNKLAFKSLHKKQLKPSKGILSQSGITCLKRHAKAHAITGVPGKQASKEVTKTIAKHVTALSECCH